MPRTYVVAILAVLSACGDASGTTTSTAATTISTSTDATLDASGSDSADASGSEDASASGSGDASDTGSGDTSATTAPTDATDTAGELGPVELYRGPVDGGSLPGWDPDVPRPLVMLGRQGQDWIATLAAIDETGALFDNVAEEIIVWGWDDTPPLLYDGPVIGGAIPDWSVDDPFPVVMLAQQTGTTSWATTLALIGPDGVLDQNLAERIVVWGWPTATPGAPTSRYAGPVDAGAVLRGWNPDAPEPLVMLGRFPGEDMWVATLARIAPDGTLSDNVTTELRVWGW